MGVISTSFPLRLVLSVHPSTPLLPLLCQKPVPLCSYAVSSQTEVTGRTHLAASRAARAPAPPRKPTAASGEQRPRCGQVGHLSRFLPSTQGTASRRPGDFGSHREPGEAQTAVPGEGRGARGASCQAKTLAEPSTLAHSRAGVAPAEAPAHSASVCHSCWNRDFRGWAPAYFLFIFTSRCASVAACPNLPLHWSRKDGIAVRASLQPVPDGAGGKDGAVGTVRPTLATNSHRAVECI